MNPWDAALDHWATIYGTWLQAGLRLLIACALGALVGLERESRGRHAGLRTNMLLALVGALVMLLAEGMLRLEWAHATEVRIQADLVRIVQAVMVGIGFMGAGIIRASGSDGQSGLTTAVGAWAVVVIGLCAGAGLVTLAAGSALIVLVVMTLLEALEKRFLTRRPVTLLLRRSWSSTAPAELAETTRRIVAVRHYTFHHAGELAEVRLTVLLSPREEVGRWAAEFAARVGWELAGVE